MSDQATEQSVEERMIGLLTAEENEEQEEIKEPEPPEQEEVEEVAESEDSQEETEPPAKLKLTRNGEEIEVDLEEAKNLAQQGYDYTQKTQKLAEERRAVEVQVQAVKAQETAIKQMAETQQAFIKEIAKVTSIDEQLAQYEHVNWNALSDSDPVQAQKLYIQYQQLQNNRVRAINEIQQKNHQLAQQRELQAQTRLEQAKAELLQAFPQWNAEMAKELRESAKAYGFSEEETSGITDPRTVKILHDAAQYRKLQSQKATTTNKVTGKPAVVKPGTKDPKSTARAADAQLMAQFKKTGNQDLAAKLIERML